MMQYRKKAWTGLPESDKEEVAYDQHEHHHSHTDRGG
jgi:hypothetical protein